jgi:WD40 repeat protein
MDRYWATVTNTCQILLWSTQTFELKGTLEGHSRSIFSLCFNGSMTMLASASEDCTARVWDTESCRELFCLKHRCSLNGVAFNSSADKLVTISDDARLYTWAVGETQTYLLEIDSGIATATDQICFSCDDQYIFSATKSTTGNMFSANVLAVWNAATGCKVRELCGHALTIKSIAVSPVGDLVATSSKDKMVIVWDTTSWALKTTMSGHTRNVRSVCFNRDGDHLISGSDDETAIIWDVNNGSLLHKFDCGPIVFGVAFSLVDAKIIVCTVRTITSYDSGNRYEESGVIQLSQTHSNWCVICPVRIVSENVVLL